MALLQNAFLWLSE